MAQCRNSVAVTERDHLTVLFLARPGMLSLSLNTPSLCTNGASGDWLPLQGDPSVPGCVQTSQNVAPTVDPPPVI